MDFIQMSARIMVELVAAKGALWLNDGWLMQNCKTGSLFSTISQQASIWQDLGEGFTPGHWWEFRIRFAEEKEETTMKAR